MTNPATGAERYSHGYHEVIVGSYTKRTAETCAAFLLPRLRPDAEVLDVGSGPGTITLGLARRASRVVGLDLSEAMVEQASGRAADGGATNTDFEVGSAYELPHDDESFDVVYSHQVMQHLAEPVRALREAYRVLRPGGLVALRDSDYETMIHAPVDPYIEHWRELYHKVAAANGGNANAGRFLLGWVRAAGFVDPVVTTGTVNHADPEAREAWGGMWAVRVVDSDFADHAVNHGLATRTELQEISAAFRRWAASPDGFWAYLCGEVIGVRPDE